jgi:hypothetical protein
MTRMFAAGATRTVPRRPSLQPPMQIRVRAGDIACGPCELAWSTVQLVIEHDALTPKAIEALLTRAAGALAPLPSWVTVTDDGSIEVPLIDAQRVPGCPDRWAIADGFAIDREGETTYFALSERHWLAAVAVVNLTFDETWMFVRALASLLATPEGRKNQR